MYLMNNCVLAIWNMKNIPRKILKTVLWIVPMSLTCRNEFSSSSHSFKIGNVLFHSAMDFKMCKAPHLWCGQFSNTGYYKTFMIIIWASFDHIKLYLFVCFKGLHGFFLKFKCISHIASHKINTAQVCVCSPSQLLLLFIYTYLCWRGAHIDFL